MKMQAKRNEKNPKDEQVARAQDDRHVWASWDLMTQQICLRETLQTNCLDLLGSAWQGALTCFNEVIRSVSSFSGATWAFGTSSTGPPDAWKISVARPQHVLELFGTNTWFTSRHVASCDTCFWVFGISCHQSWTSNSIIGSYRIFVHHHCNTHDVSWCIYIYYIYIIHCSIHTVYLYISMYIYHIYFYIFILYTRNMSLYFSYFTYFASRTCLGLPENSWQPPWAPEDRRGMAGHCRHWPRFIATECHDSWCTRRKNMAKHGKSTESLWISGMYAECNKQRLVRHAMRKDRGCAICTIWL